MNEGEKPKIIPTDVLKQFNHLVEISIAKNPLVSTKPLKYKVGSKVWIQKLETESTAIEILQAAAGVYLVRDTDGEYTACNEEDIQTVN